MPLFYFLDSDVAINLGLLSVTEELMHELVLFCKLIIEGIAVLIIVLSVVKAVPKVVRVFKRTRSEIFYSKIRLELGLNLVLALEFLLAADVLGTAISPNWHDIGVLAAIAGIRTFLNFFLEKEVKDIEQETHLQSQENTL